ncbi:MAG: PrsW family glutamic-type intramembrane protease [Paludibacteraceae bacterium]
MNLLIAAVLPVFILMIYFYSKDKFEKEPLKTLMKAFFGGVLSTLPVVFIAVNTAFPSAENAFGAYTAFIHSFLEAAIPEEISKFAFLFLFIWWDKNFNEYYDGILYAVFVSLGFACLENILYVAEHGMEIVFSRALLAVPLHALCGVIMGYYFSLAKFTIHKNLNLLKAVFFAILAHGIYDFILFYLAPYVAVNPVFGVLSTFLVFIFVGFLWRISLKKVKLHVNQSVFKDRRPGEMV